MLPWLAQFHVSFPGLGIHNVPISRIAFEFDVFGRHVIVYWYGLIFAVAMILCIVLAMTQAKHHRLTSDDILDFFLWMIPFILVFARIYYVAFEWDQFRDHPRSIWDLRSGGLAFYGGVIGGIIALAIASRIKRIKLRRVLDSFAVYVPLGQGIGRWGNFFNQEAFGTNTTLPWGMISEGTRAGLARVQANPDYAGAAIDPNLPVHPTFFYEFVANMLIFALLLYLRKHSKRPYTCVLTYFLTYGIVRFFVEGIRTDALMFHAGGYVFRVSQVISVVMIAAAIIGFVIQHVRAKTREAVLASMAGIPDDVIEIVEADLDDTPADA